MLKVPGTSHHLKERRGTRSSRNTATEYRASIFRVNHFLKQGDVEVEVAVTSTMAHLRGIILETAAQRNEIYQVVVRHVTLD